MRSDQWNEVRGEIERAASFLARGANAAEGRAERAADAGAALAAEVYRYCQDPDGVGADALDAAYQQFMGLHSGNFNPVGV